MSCDRNDYDEAIIDIYFYDDNGQPLNFYYSIELERDERYWGYCECTPDDKRYNPLYGCCGESCDWVAPSIRIVRHTDIIKKNTKKGVNKYD